MDLTLFLTIFLIGATLSSLITEAIKKTELGTKTSSNLIVLIVSIITGGIGTVIYYILTDIGFDTKSIICIFLEIVAQWLGAMVGYDKITELLEQLKK